MPALYVFLESKTHTKEQNYCQYKFIFLNKQRVERVELQLLDH